MMNLLSILPHHWWYQWCMSRFGGFLSWPHSDKWACRGALIGVILHVRSHHRIDYNEMVLQRITKMSARLLRLPFCLCLSAAILIAGWQSSSTQVWAEAPQTGRRKMMCRRWMGGRRLDWPICTSNRRALAKPRRCF